MKIQPWETNKRNYIDFTDMSKESKRVKYNLYEKNIKAYEDIKGKDLMEFNVGELMDLMDSIPTTSRSVKDNVYSFITQYLDYQISRGTISINNMVGVNREEATTIHKRSSKSKYMSMRKFKEIISNIDNKIDTQHIIPLILCRYGIKGKDAADAISLRLEDIDENSKIAKIIDEPNNVIKYIPVDDYFIDWCKKASSEGDYEGSNVIKFGTASRGNEITEAIIHNRVKKACDAGNYKRISLNNLVLSRKIDLILDIRKERKLTNGDFQSINLIFNPLASAGSYNTLARFYESLSGGDKVYRADEDKETLKDENAEEFVEKLKRELEIGE